MSTSDTGAPPAPETSAAAPAGPMVRLRNKGESGLVVAYQGRTYEIPPGESQLSLELWEKLQTKEAVQFWLAPFEKVFIRSKDGGPTTVERKPLLDKAGKRVPPTLEVLQG